MIDWDAYLKSEPWQVRSDQEIHVSEPLPGSSLPGLTGKMFPVLSSLLAKSTVTPVQIDGEPHRLHAWEAEEGYRTGWLCPAPPVSGVPGLCPDHAVLIRSFGGIANRFNESEDTWLCNLDEALTAGEAKHDAGLVEECPAFSADTNPVPIVTEDFYAIAREANGNMTYCHRRSGEIILFAQDHAFSHVTPYEGCPEYTLYRVKGGATFREWVETVARQWASTLE